MVIWSGAVTDDSDACEDNTLSAIDLDIQMEEEHCHSQTVMKSFANRCPPQLAKCSQACTTNLQQKWNGTSFQACDFSSPQFGRKEVVPDRDLRVHHRQRPLHRGRGQLKKKKERSHEIVFFSGLRRYLLGRRQLRCSRDQVPRPAA